MSSRPCRHVLSSTHWSWTLAFLAFRDRCCKRRGNINGDGETEKTDSSRLQSDPPPSPHGPKECCAPWEAVCRGPAINTRNFLTSPCAQLRTEGKKHTVGKSKFLQILKYVSEAEDEHKLLIRDLPSPTEGKLTSRQ